MTLLVIYMYCISNGWDIPQDESILVTLPRLTAADGKCGYFLVMYSYLLSGLTSENPGS